MHTEHQRQIFLWLLLLSGFLAGSALPELLHMGTGTYASFFSLYGLQKYQEAQADLGRVFSYVLTARLRPLLFLWMSSFTTAGLLFHAFYFWWLAAAAGMLLALFVLRSGLNGMLLFGCCLFPQWILYAAMWREEAEFLIRQRKKFPQICAVSAGRFWRTDLWTLARLAGYCLMGALTETFLGNWTMKIFLRL